MLICYNCGELFDEWEIRYEPEPHGEMRGHCPNCGDDQFGEAEECTRCGHHYPPSRMAGSYCEECREELLGRIRRAVLHALNELNEEEVDYLEGEFYAAKERWMCRGRRSI